MPDIQHEPSFLTAATRLVRDFTNRPVAARCRPLPVVTIHAPPGGGLDEAFRRVRTASERFPHAVLNADDRALKTVREVMYQLYGNLALRRTGYGRLPMPRFGLIVIAVDIARAHRGEQLRPEHFEKLIPEWLAKPRELNDALLRAGLNFLASLGLPGISDAGADLIALVFKLSFAKARWIRITKRARGIVDHLGNVATARSDVSYRVGSLALAAVRTEGLNAEKRHAVDRVLCDALLMDLLDAFTVRRRSVRVRRTCRLLINEYAENTAARRFCDLVVELRQERGLAHAVDFDPLTIVAFDPRWPFKGATPIAQAGYAHWATETDGKLYREDAWRYPVQLEPLNDQDILRMLDAAGMAPRSENADRILELTDGNLRRCEALIAILRDNPQLDIGDDADLPEIERRLGPNGEKT